MAARRQEREVALHLPQQLLARAADGDDSRPILCKTDAGAAGLVCVLGGKIDNVYDVDRELERLLGPGVEAAAGGGAEGAR